MATSLEPAISSDSFEIISERLFLISDVPYVWPVHEGTVDLFLQETRDGDLVGPLSHITRVPAGEAMFGIMGGGSTGFAVVAVPSSDSRVARTPQVNLQGQGEQLSPNERTVEWIDMWILRLAEAISGTAMPKKFVPVSPEQRFETRDLPEIVAPIQGVLWAKCLSGNSRFLAAQTISSENAPYFPICKYGWLEVAGQSAILAQPTQYWHSEDRNWKGLHAFHNVVLTCLIVKQNDDEERERARLLAKFQATRAAVNTAFRWLARTLDKNSEPEPEGHLQRGPLARAYHEVGRSLGIKIADVPNITDKQKYKEPVAVIAKASSIRARRVLLKGSWWKYDCGPLIAFRLDMDSPVSLLRRPSGWYELYDPIAEKRTRVTASVASTLSGIGYSIYRPFPETPIRLNELLRFGITGSKRDLWLIVSMGMAGGLLGLVAPLVMGVMFDSAIPGAQRNQVSVLSMFLLVSAICSGLFSLTRNFAIQRLQGKLDAILQSAAWDRLLRLPVAVFRNYSSGDLAMRSLAFKEIGEILSGPVLSLILSQMFSLLSFGLLFAYSWRLALIGCILIFIAIVVSMLCMRLYLKYYSEAIKLRGKVSGILLELMNGVAKFRVSGTEGKAFAVWAPISADRRRNTVGARRSVAIIMGFRQGWPIISAAAIFYFGTKMITQSNTAMTTGSFLAFMAVFNQVMVSSLSIVGSVLPLLSIVPVYERAKPILEAVPEVDSGKAHPGELRGAIEVKHLIFRYTPEGPPVLRDVSFAIAPGENVAIVGASGSGKSTLFRMLLGFERPESGTIYYDGQDLAGLDVQSVREQIGTVVQNGKLGAGTIFNLIIGSSLLTIEDAWEAARMTGLDKDIADMPMGMHTAITQGGGMLSGGQRQRLLIASAIVNRPRIFFFDEATSALDNQTQATVTRSLESLRATRLVIAHRLSTIVNADRILVLDRGKVAQVGYYQDLISRPGPFRDLAARQLA